VCSVNRPHVTTDDATWMFHQPESLISSGFVMNIRNLASVGAYYAPRQNSWVNNGITAANFGEKIAVIISPRCVSQHHTGIRGGRNSSRCKNCCAFGVDSELYSKNQADIKSIKLHPVNKSETRNLAQGYDLTNIGRDSLPLPAEKISWDKVSSVLPIAPVRER